MQRRDRERRAAAVAAAHAARVCRDMRARRQVVVQARRSITQTAVVAALRESERVRNLVQVEFSKRSRERAESCKRAREDASAALALCEREHERQRVRLLESPVWGIEWSRAWASMNTAYAGIL